MTDRAQAARLLAGKIATLASIVPDREGCDRVRVSTAELCKAMGQADGAKLEDVQDFARSVVALLDGHGLDTGCGCGYLALEVGPAEVVARALAEGRDPTVFTPADLDAYLAEVTSGP